MSADQTLRGWLDGLRRRWRALTRLRVSARQAAAVAVIAGAAWAVDAATSPTGLALVGLFVAAIVAAVGRRASACRRRCAGRRAIASSRGSPRSRTARSTTWWSPRPSGSSAEAPGPLDGLLVRAAEARLREVEPERVIARDTMRRALRWTAAARGGAGDRAGVRVVAGVARRADGPPLHRAAEAGGRRHARPRAHRPRHAAAHHRPPRRPARRRDAGRAGADRRGGRRGAAADAARGQPATSSTGRRSTPTSATASSPAR